MNLKTLLNGAVLFIGLGLTAYAWLNGYRVRFGVEDVAVDPESEESGRELEEWQLVPRSIYDGDTLRVQRGDEELKIRFCGIDAPERDQELGIEARDYLRARGTSEPLAR